MKKILVTGLWTLLLTTVLTVPAFAQELVVGGQVVGVQISTDGVMVAGVSQIETGDGSALSPAESAGVKPGDLIVSVDGQRVSGAADVISAVDACQGGAVKLSVVRGGRELSFCVEPVRSADGQWLLGLWLRDGLSGLGTLTFCDPDSGVFGALGHSINDSDSGLTVPVKEGSITDAQIVSVNPGSSGSPGELNGCADLSRVLGSIELNTDHGIFGQAFVDMDGRRLETGSMCVGPASIVSTISGRSSREYSVEINRIYREADGTHAMLSVTDPELIQRTGGIVQGMSGSPIIQNGKFVGAVTHVFVSDPTRGYAVSIQDMLHAAGIDQSKAA